MKMSALLLAVTFTALATVARAQSPSGSTAARPAAPATAASPAAKSLYARLGGVYPISMVVDDFIERLLVNDTLNANPAIEEARRRVPKAGLKFHVTALVCQATGGPCAYSGRDMKTAHAHLHITAREWDAMLADFRKTLDKFAVPAAEQGELFAIVNGTRADIVVDARTSSR
jgi:hemoglobin